MLSKIRNSFLSFKWHF